MKTRSNKADAYQIVTDQIIEAMESESSNWTNPMIRAAGYPFNGTTGNNYNGINVLLLGLAGGGAFASYKQWQGKGCQVRKGEKGVKIIFFKVLEKEVEGKIEKFPMARVSTVFRFSQVDGEFAEQFKTPAVDTTAAIEAADKWVSATGADIRTADEGRAFYMPSQDFIQMPPRNGFTNTPTSTSTEAYYGVLLHELTHWTGHKTRLDRLEDKNAQGYAYEELVAELGAAFQCCLLGVTAEPRPDHAHYLNSWIAALKNDKKLIVKAARQAQAAVDYIGGLQDQQQAA